MRWNKFILLPLAFACSGFAQAQEINQTSANAIEVYGNACEKLNKGEPKSSVRVRVTDMASYAAAENMPAVAQYRKKLNDHDFSILIYNLIDNYLDDINVKTIVEDGRELCVEVRGSVNADNLQTAWQETLDELQHRAEIAQMEAKAHPNPQELYPEVDAPTPKMLIQPNGISDTPPAKLYFEPTRFYNNTRSNNFAKILKQIFAEMPNVEIVESPQEADYTIYSDVLRAKVDPINDHNNRLQMVVSLELRNAENHIMITEHQNRFVLFTAEENEQDVAFRLLKKLFKNAAKLLYKKIERDNNRDEVKERAQSELITPNP